MLTVFIFSVSLNAVPFPWYILFAKWKVNLLFFLSLLQLLYVETEETRSIHNALPLHSSVTPTKRVDVDRTVMPDGTIVTTVTTVQSRLKLERSPGRCAE